MTVKVCFLVIFFIFPLTISIGPSSHLYFRNFFNHARDCGKSSENYLKRFIALRTGDNNQNPVFWYYSGVVRNPSNGVAISGIEGVEYVVPIPEQLISSSDHAIDLTTERSSQGNSDKANNHDTKLYSYLTKKLFFYVNPHNSQELLTKFRVQQSAPAREVNPITSFSEYVKFYTHPDSKKLHSVIEFPGQRELFPQKVQIIKDGETSSVDVEDDEGTSRISQENFDQERYHIGHIVTGGKRPQKSSFLNSLVSFSASSASSPLHGKSQEYFSIWRNKSNKGRLQALFSRWNPKSALDTTNQIQFDYIRYGESPAWAIPGTSCLTEIHAQCFPEGYNSLPDNIRSLVEKHQAQFIQQLPQSSNKYDALQLFKLEEDKYQSYATPWYKRLFNRMKK